MFLELIRPATLLTIYGAGNDAQALAKQAKNLGWRVQVTDGRPMLVTAQRFPQAERVQVARVGELDKHINNKGFAVLMSHNYHYDLAVLQALNTAADVRYIGILGPRKKTELLLAALAEKDIDTDLLEQRIYSPVGLDIGAENADEIALAIMAELLAVRNGLKAGFLRDLDAPIHNRNLTIKTI